MAARSKVPPARSRSPRTGQAVADVEPHVAYTTKFGSAICGDVVAALDSTHLKKKRGKVQLVFTSPPFPLNRKKRYGNMQGEEYVKWLASLAPKLAELLTPNGSIVMELGNAWVSGEPVMSLLPLQALMAFVAEGKLHLCQQFVSFNPARLPSPAEWVTVRRIRVKDAYTNVWWMAPTTTPKADNRRVLTAYSPAMKRLLDTKKYNAGKRPSQFNVREKTFLKDNDGAIPPNVLTIANTGSMDKFSVYCRDHGIRQHPARMPPAVAEFFIRYLTEPGDLVLDPFGGSNTTGSVAESLGRKWVSIERDPEYVKASRSRFDLVVDAAESSPSSPRG